MEKKETIRNKGSLENLTCLLAWTAIIECYKATVYMQMVSSAKYKFNQYKTQHGDK